MDELLEIGVALGLAGLVGEVAARVFRLPRITGYALTGLLLGPVGLRWLGTRDIDNMRVLVDLALGLVLFELGVRVDLRWFRNNPQMLASSLIEAALAFGAIFAVLRYTLGLPLGHSATLAAIGMSTCPAAVMGVCAEEHSDGQVSQRLHVLCALNVLYAAVASKLIPSGQHGAFSGDWLTAMAQPIILMAGSLVVGWLLSLAYRLVQRFVAGYDNDAVALLFGLLLISIWAMSALKLPALLAPLVAGVLVKNLDPRPHLWPHHFGSAGALLVLTLLLLTEAACTKEQLLTGGLAAAAFIGARLAGKLLGSLALGPRSGLSFKQSAALGLSLSPLSAVAWVLGEDIFSLYPAYREAMAPILLAAILLLGVLGPVVVKLALKLAGETRRKT